MKWSILVILSLIISCSNNGGGKPRKQRVIIKEKAEGYLQNAKNLSHEQFLNEIQSYNELFKVDELASVTNVKVKEYFIKKENKDYKCQEEKTIKATIIKRSGNKFEELQQTKVTYSAPECAPEKAEPAENNLIIKRSIKSETNLEVTEHNIDFFKNCSFKKGEIKSTLHFEIKCPMKKVNEIGEITHRGYYLLYINPLLRFHYNPTNLLITLKDKDEKEVIEVHTRVTKRDRSREDLPIEGTPKVNQEYYKYKLYLLHKGVN